MNRRVFLVYLFAASILPTTAFPQSFLKQYSGLPYRDRRYQGGSQKIPGRVLCAYYDLGGEAVAYHDPDQQNHGSGELNPADGTYLDEFRIHEGVDTSYTKFQRKTEGQTVDPLRHQLLHAVCNEIRIPVVPEAGRKLAHDPDARSGWATCKERV